MFRHCLLGDGIEQPIVVVVLSSNRLWWHHIFYCWRYTSTVLLRLTVAHPISLTSLAESGSDPYKYLLTSNTLRGGDHIYTKLISSVSLDVVSFRADCYRALLSVTQSGNRRSDIVDPLLHRATVSTKHVTCGNAFVVAARKASCLYIPSRLWKWFVLVRINEVGVAYDLIIGYFDKYRAKEHDHDMRQLVYIVNRVPRKQGVLISN
jgi:hypothetical protein